MKKFSRFRKRQGRSSKFRGSRRQKHYSKRINSYRVARGGIRL